MPTNTKWYWSKKRPDWKTNYEHYQWTAKRRKYRSELNTENRKRWNYGNWDEKDLHHIWNNPNAKKKATISQSANRKMWAQKANKKRWW